MKTEESARPDRLERLFRECTSAMLVVALLGQAVAADAQGYPTRISERQNPDLATRCRALIRSRAGVPVASWSADDIGLIVQCDQSGPPFVGALWRALPAIAIGIQDLRMSSRPLADGRLFDSLAATARNASATDEVRARALDVLVGLVFPRVAIVPLPPISAESGGGFVLGGDAPPIEGAVPLPKGAEWQLRALVTNLSTSDPSTATKSYAARVLRGMDVERWFRSLPTVDPKKIKLDYVCGNRFRIRNQNDVLVIVTFDVEGSQRPVVELQIAARPPQGPAAETVFDARATGTVRLFVEGRLIERQENKKKTCK